MPRKRLIQVRRGLAGAWATADPVLDSGEPGFDASTALLKIGDGVQRWSALPAVQWQTHRAEDIRSFGGGTTESAATNSTALAEAAAAGGEIVLGRGGTFNFLNPAAIPQRRKLSGHGHFTSIMQLDPSSTNGFEVGPFCEITDMGFNGGGANVAVVTGRDAMRFMGNNINIENSASDGLVFVADVGLAHGAQIDNLRIRDCDGIGLHFGVSCFDAKLANIEIGTCGVGARFDSGAHRASIFHVWGCTNQGLYIASDLNVLEDVYLDTNGAQGLYATSAVTRGVVVIGGYAWNNGGGGLQFDGADRNTLIGLLLEDNTGFGIRLTDSSHSTLSDIQSIEGATVTSTYGIEETGSTDYTTYANVHALDVDHGTAGLLTVGIHDQFVNVVTTSHAFNGQKLTRNRAGMAARAAIDGPAGQNRSLTFQTADSDRWELTANTTAETGSNAGSNFAITARSDAGAFIANAVSIVRSTGRVTVPNGLQLGNTSAAAGTLYSGSGVASAGLGSNGDAYLRTDTPGTANQRLYIKSAGAWVGVV